MAREIQQIPMPRMPSDLGMEEQRMQEAHKKVQQVYGSTVEQIDDDSFTANVGDFFGTAWIFLLLALLVVFVGGAMMAGEKEMGVGSGFKAVWAVISGIFKGIVGLVKFAVTSWLVVIWTSIAAVIAFGIYVVFI